MIIFGALLLLAGIFINRPYCRYLCPYGVLLSIFSRFAGKHLSITPAECTECRLCEEACPYDAILPSISITSSENQGKARRRFIVYLLLIPLFTAASALVFYNLAPSLASINRDVRLAKEIRNERVTGIEAVSKAAVAFKEAGKTEKELFAGEMRIIEHFRKASPWAGAFLGLSLGISLVSFTTKHSRIGYKPHQGKCYSCGRCFKYCPVEVKN
jgi:NAD-dependent dihydropyrimidine dehydrogenase PreA subunit